MKGIERVFSQIGGNIGDRRSATVLVSMYGARVLNMSNREYYFLPERYIEAQSRLYDKLQQDILFTPFLVAKEAEGFGAQLFYHEHTPPNVLTPIYADAEELLNAPLPNIMKNNSYVYLLKTLQGLVKHHKGDAAIAAVSLGPSDLPALLLGIEKWLETIILRPQLAQKIIYKFSEHYLEWFSILQNEGADCIITPALFANPQIVTVDLMTKVILTPLKEFFAGVKAPVIIHHGGAMLAPFIDQFAEMPNLLGVVIDKRDDPLQIRKQVGKERLIFGNIEGFRFDSLSKEEMGNQTKELLTKMKDDPRFILATSGPDIPLSTDLSKIEEFLSYVRV